MPLKSFDSRLPIRFHPMCGTFGVGGCLEASNTRVEQPETVGVALLAAAAHDLHPDAYAEHGTAQRADDLGKRRRP